MDVTDISALREYIQKIQQQIISGMLNDVQYVQKTLFVLGQTDFDDYPCRCFFGIIQDLYNKNLAINTTTVTNIVLANKDYQFSNWQERLKIIELSYYPPLADLNATLDILKNYNIKKNLDAFAKSIIETKYDLSHYSEQVFNLEKKFQDIISVKKSSNIESINEIAQKYLEKLQNADLEKSKGTCVGFNFIDKKTNGFQNGDLVILAARPGVGKTALALNFAYNCALNLHKKQEEKEKRKIVVYFSLEMSKEQLFQRLVALNGQISTANLRSGNLDAEDRKRTDACCHELAQLPILIDDTSELTLLDIQLKIMQLKNEYDVKLIIIDYLQLISSYGGGKNTLINRQQEIAAISRGLKLLARLAECPIISLAQLSRKIEERADKRPLLSDLRDSGSIEQDADMVCFLSKVDNDELMQTNNNLVSEILFEAAKFRNGSLFAQSISFVKSYNLFLEPQQKKNE